MLLSAGDHVPVKPSFDVVGRVNDSPVQIAVIGSNVACTGPPTVTFILAVSAQNPGLGVKIYVVVAILFGNGVQVPGVPLEDVVGKIILPPEQIGAC